MKTTYNINNKISLADRICDVLFLGQNFRSGRKVKKKFNGFGGMWYNSIDRQIMGYGRESVKFTGGSESLRKCLLKRI